MRRRQRAFTILELLTVVAILGLLMAIIVPSLSGARRAAKANVCISKLKGLALAFSVYLNENRDTFPPFRLRKLDPTLPNGPEHEYVNDYNNKSPRWHWFLELDSGPVIDDKPFRRLNRPWGDDGLRLGRDKSGTTMTNDAFTCPVLEDEEFANDIRSGAFGYNYQYLGNARQDTHPQRWDNFPVASQRIKSPTQTVLIADSRGGGVPHGLHSYTMDPPRLGTEVGATQFGPGVSDRPAGFDEATADLLRFSPVEMRHNDKGNVAFVDNHAEAMTLIQLGYEIADIDRFRGVAKPVFDPALGVHATNKLWNGQGGDPLAHPTAP